MDFNPLDKYIIEKTALGIGTYGSVHKRAGIRSVNET
jgi:hypothetical protein